MTDAIQKAREALTAARESLTWGYESASALAKIDAALAALDAETPATPAADDRIVRKVVEAREHIRKQADDIMTLGQLVYADTDTTWKARAESAEAKLAEARNHLANALMIACRNEWGAELEAARRFLEETK